MSKSHLAAWLATQPQADLFAPRVHPLPCLSCGGVVHVLPNADIEQSAGFSCENCGDVLYFVGYSDTLKYIRGWLKPDELEVMARKYPEPPDYLTLDEPF
jgi:hypothetical protein